jgi:signal transduction histidine kinase/CheY-like chemotaxis protein
LLPESVSDLMETLPEPVALLNVKGEILSANRQFERIFSRNGTAVAGKNLSEFSPTPKEKIFQYLENCSRSRQVIFGALDLRGEDGEASYRCEGALLKPAAENSPAVIFLRLKPKESAGSRFILLTQKIEQLNKEIAERRRAERRSEQLYLEAEHANRLKDEFLATISHELRTPLNAILGWTRMLRSGSLDENSVAKAIETIERNSYAQKQLVEDLLDVSRIITGKLTINLRPVEAASVIENAVNTVRPMAENKSIRLEINLESNVGLISADADRLQQVIWNLLTNAIKFTPKYGRVEVRLARVNSNIEITISDSGIGIEPEFLPHVFERFLQADASKSRVHGGLGLGLAITRHLVELHGGSVAAFSEGKNRGATFTIRLPVLFVLNEENFFERVNELKQLPETAMEKFECPPSLKNLRVLIVEDQPDARELLRVILEKCEAEATVAASAAEAFQKFSETEFDILVSDIAMPGEDGYSLIKKIRGVDEKLKREIPAVALTAHARAEDRLRILSAGFDSHIAKPFEPAELVAVIESLARRIKSE